MMDKNEGKDELINLMKIDDLTENYDGRIIFKLKI